MDVNSNLTTDRPTFVTHLECSLTGERYRGGCSCTACRAAGRPLLVRYDLDGAAPAPDQARRSPRGRPTVALARVAAGARAADIVSLGEIETPLVPLPRSRAAGAANVLVKDEGRLPTGSFKARGLVMAVSMAKALRRHAGSRCRPTAMPAPRSPPMRARAGIEIDRLLPRRHAGDQRARDRGCTARASTASTA